MPNPSIERTCSSKLRLIPCPLVKRQAPYTSSSPAMRLTSLLLLAPALWANAQAQGSAQAPLDCSAGPFTKSFGAVPWWVYGCSDNKSVVVVSAPDSPAAPFYFMLFEKEGKYVVVGEGTGKKSVTDRAHAELVRLSDVEIQALIASAKQATKR
jgi:hypothetical protein